MDGEEMIPMRDAMSACIRDGVFGYSGIEYVRSVPGGAPGSSFLGGRSTDGRGRAVEA